MTITLKEYVGRVWAQFWEDRVLDRSAILSFYFLLSIFPLLLFLLATLGVFLQSGPFLQETLRKYLTAVMPGAAYDLVNSTIQEISQGSSGGKLSLGLLFTLWTASRGMVAIIDGLNVAYKVGESRPWWKQNGIALILTAAFMALVAALFMLILYGTRLSEAVITTSALSGWKAGSWAIGSWMVVLSFVLLAFNILYIFAPNVKHRNWRWLMPGTVVGVILWLLVSFGFKLYLEFFNRYTVTYGSIGTVIILLLWFYLSGIAILVGAEVNSVHERAAHTVKKRGEGS